MRKIIVEIHPKVLKLASMEDIFDTLDSMEGRSVLRLNLAERVKIILVDLKMKPGYRIDDLKIPRNFTRVTVLDQKEGVYTCLLQINYPKNIATRLQTYVRSFILKDIIFDVPFGLSPDRIVFSFVAENERIEKVLKLLQKLGIVKKVHFQKATFSENNVLSALTERQREILITAKKAGYYERPRKVTSEELAEQVGISKATMIEHLRKAENRLISQILTGY